MTRLINVRMIIHILIHILIVRSPTVAIVDEAGVRETKKREGSWRKDRGCEEREVWEDEREKRG